MFTEETKTKLYEAIRKGAPYELACNAAGICYNTFRKYMMKGEEGIEEEYVQFMKAIKKAEGETSLKWMQKIDEASDKGNWQAAAWKLERRYFKYFSAKAADIDFNERLEALEDKDKGQKNVESLRKESA